MKKNQFPYFILSQEELESLSAEIDEIDDDLEKYIHSDLKNDYCISLYTNRINEILQILEISFYWRRRSNLKLLKGGKND